MKKTVAGAASALAVVAVIAATACSGGTTTVKEVPAALPATHTSAPAKPSPAVTKTVTAKPAPAVTKTAAPSAPVIINNNVPAATPAPVYVAPAAPPAPVDNYDPYAVVSQYYADEESGDYSDAWDLGGSTLSPNYSDFVAGYENTGAQSITENWESGDTVSINLSAVDDNAEDDPTQYFACQYTVDQSTGSITGGSCTQTGGPS